MATTKVPLDTETTIPSGALVLVGPLTVASVTGGGTLPQNESFTTIDTLAVTVEQGSVVYQTAGA